VKPGPETYRFVDVLSESDRARVVHAQVPRGRGTCLLKQLRSSGKPANVELRERELALIRSLDIATRDRASPAGARALAGSPTHASPEQTGRLGRVVDRRSDLYALGARDDAPSPEVQESSTDAAQFYSLSRRSTVTLHARRAA
jgi:hypothetical protein